MWYGQNGLIAYSSHDIPLMRAIEKLQTEPLSGRDIKQEAKNRIDKLLNEARATREEQSIGWNGRGLS